MEGMESFKLQTSYREKLSREHALDTAMAREREGERRRLMTGGPGAHVFAILWLEFLDFHDFETEFSLTPL